MNSKQYLGVAVSVNGNIFAHPCDGTPEADTAAKERGDYPYTHLYEGDNVNHIVQEMVENEVVYQYIENLQKNYDYYNQE